MAFSCAFPPPPAHYNLFQSPGIGIGNAAEGAEGSTFPIAPPPPPSSSSWRMFGAEYKVSIESIIHLLTVFK